MDSPGALGGVRVLDLADASGALCGKLLADMGADVIAVEPPDGNPLRHAGSSCTTGAPPDSSLHFWHYSTNKRSVVLDLATSQARDSFKRLVATADIVIDTASPGFLSSIGLGYDTLGKHHPGLIQVSITPFGQTGPYRDYRGSDLVGQAVGGMAFVNGFPDEAPQPGFGPQAYHSASAYAAIGALLALLARARDGRGQWIDVSIQECVAAAVEHASSFFHQNGTIAERQGSLHWTRYFRVGECRDGYVMHCTLGDWTSLLEWIKGDGKAKDLDDPAWEEPTHRRDHCVHLFDVLDDWAKDFSVAELVDGAQLRRLPYAAVLPPETLPANPQLAARGFFVPVRNDQIDAPLPYPGAPYVFSRTPWRIRCHPPRLGEHTDEILRQVEESGALPGRPEVSQSGPQASPAQRALDGVRIIDFTWVVAGPVATRILADHGAEVIKIERRNATDFGSRRGGLTGNLNRGKHSIVLDMSQPRGIELAQQLIATADVVIDNFSARVMRNWGLDYAHLQRIKPDIVAVSMSGFGHTGPWQDYVSYGPTLQALAGYTLSMRQPGRPPAGWGFSYSDMAGGYSGALAVLIALWHRRRSGEGQHVDLSQFESLVSLIGPRLLEILAGAAVEMPVTYTGGVYRCADLPGDGAARDRWCAISITDETDWQHLCTALGTPSWSTDPRFADAASRGAHRGALDARLETWTRCRSAEDVMTHLQRAGVAAGVVANAEDVCRRDPHLQARSYWTRIATPEGERVECDGVPFKMSRTPGHIAAPGPLLGEHTDAILQRVLGLSPESIAALRAQRVVA